MKFVIVSSVSKLSAERSVAFENEGFVAYFLSFTLFPRTPRSKLVAFSNFFLLLFESR